MPRGMRKTVETEARKARIAKAEERGEERRSIKEKRREGGKTKKAEKEKDDRGKKGSRRVGDLG